MKYGFLRAACCSPKLKVADCKFNAEKIIDRTRFLSSCGAEVVVFPELCITSYTCADLFLQKTLQKSAVEELERIAKKTSNCDCILCVGLPLAIENNLYNCGAVIYKGKILAIVPKTYIPNYSEFYEKRYFSCGNECENQIVFLSKQNTQVPFGTNIIIKDSNNSDFSLAIELCEDLWVPLPPSTTLSLAGASVIANLSASNEIVGKAEYRRNLVKMQSAHEICAYLYADAGEDESTQDLVFSGHNIICENGTILEQSKLFSTKDYIMSDVDLERLFQERRRTTTFAQCANSVHQNVKKDIKTVFVDFKGNRLKDSSLLRFVEPHPFVPENSEKRKERCQEVVDMQAHGLAKRLRHINCTNAVIGLSGGLDSTLALLVTCRAFDLCNFDRKGIFAVTMPCFGTTERTHSNACLLAQECGVSLKEVNIAASVMQHFKDIEQNPEKHDVTYENCQARERTQVLMDIANKNNGIVIGTGDLSELALGWCTYNGDQMSMYGVNSSIPKTLVRHLVSYFADEADEKLSKVLTDILETPVSPELLPPENGSISQKTEDLVGPYELHDFFLYYILRYGFEPQKILFLADSSELKYTHDFKLRWLRTFYKRFFSQQFKRSCMPDGAKVGTVNFSPRGDWRMPSDASCSLWLEQIDSIK